MKFELGFMGATPPPPKRTRKPKPSYYTRGMVSYQRTLPIRVTVAVRPLIKRYGPPTIGSCFFDEQNRLIYIVSNPAIRYFTWHRVYTDGTLSQSVYSGQIDAVAKRRGTR